MPRFTKILGTLLTTASLSFAIFYLLWFFGFLPIDPELAVKIPVLAIVLAGCFISAWLGYVMATAPIKREHQQRGGSR